MTEDHPATADAPESIRLQDDGTWTGGERAVEWSPADAASFREQLGIDERSKALRKLYRDGAKQLAAAEARIEAEAPRVEELAERLASGDAGALAPEDVTALTYLASAWVLRRNLDVMHAADPRIALDDEAFGTEGVGGLDPTSYIVRVGHGEMQRVIGAARR